MAESTLSNFWIVLGLGLMTSAGLRLVLEKPPLKRIFGLTVLSHAVNIFLLLAGISSTRELHPAVLSGIVPFEKLLDPLPQALILTSIVINFGLLAYLLIYFLTAERGGKT